MRILSIIFVSLTLSLGATAAWAQDGDRARRLELATRFVDLSMGEELPKLVDQIIEEELAANPDMPQEERDWMRRNMPALTMTMIEDIGSQLGPVYADAFTVPELEALVAFYETPLGRSIATKQFEIGARSQEILAGALGRFFERLVTKYCQEFDCEEVPVAPSSGK
ncbi:MAG: DUF2059 domain-containing protein [Caulobacteraceae bacterium]|nr:DUF2059 domain-containing protein [Caulobacteraceae bacterium]